MIDRVTATTWACELSHLALWLEQPPAPSLRRSGCLTFPSPRHFPICRVVDQAWQDSLREWGRVVSDLTLCQDQLAKASSIRWKAETLPAPPAPGNRILSMGLWVDGMKGRGSPGPSVPRMLQSYPPASHELWFCSSGQVPTWHEALDSSLGLP